MITDSHDKYVNHEQICQKFYYNNPSDHYYLSYTQQVRNTWASAEEHRFLK